MDKTKDSNGIFIVDGGEVVYGVSDEKIELQLFLGGEIRKLRANNHILDYEKFVKARNSTKKEHKKVR